MQNAAYSFYSYTARSVTVERHLFLLSLNSTRSRGSKAIIQPTNCRKRTDLCKHAKVYILQTKANPFYFQHMFAYAMVLI